MCCFNKVNLSAILSVHKRIINKDCTVKNNNEIQNGSCWLLWCNAAGRILIGHGVGQSTQTLFFSE
jgi:hypothetical protein